LYLCLNGQSSLNGDSIVSGIRFELFDLLVIW